MTRMKKPICLLASFVLLLCTGAASAQLSGYEREKIERALLSVVEQDMAIFDGRAFNPDAQLDVAYRFMNDFTKSTNRLVALVNGLSGSARSSAEGAALVKNVQDKIAYSRAMSSQFRAFESQKNQAAAASTTAPASDSNATTTATPEAPAAPRLPTADERAQAQAQFDRIDKLMDSGIFDGEDFLPGTSRADAAGFESDYVGASNAAIAAINRWSAESRRSSDGRTFISRANDIQNRARRLRGALSRYIYALDQAENKKRQQQLDVANARRAEQSKVCNVLINAFRTNNVAISKLVSASVTNNESDDFEWTVAADEQAMRALDADSAQEFLSVDEACQQPDFKPILAGEFHCAGSRYAGNNHVGWCKVAASYREVYHQMQQEIAARAAAKPVEACEAFDKEVMTRRRTRQMAALFEDPQGSNLSAEEMLRLLKATDKVVNACAKEEYAALLEHSCSETPAEDPMHWCAVAAETKDAFRNGILNPVHDNWEMFAETRYPSEDELLSRDGWVDIEGPTTWAQVISFHRMRYSSAGLLEDGMALYDQLGITEQDFPFYDGAMEYIEEMQEVIEENVADWDPVAQADNGEDFTGYGTALGSRLFTAWHEDAEVMDSWLGRGTWKIHRNALGVAEKRSLKGYVLFKLPEDPFCQLRSFTLVEQNIGGDSYQEAGGVSPGYVRFQSCDRR